MDVDRRRVVEFVEFRFNEALFFQDFNGPVKLFWRDPYLVVPIFAPFREPFLSVFDHAQLTCARFVGKVPKYDLA